MNLKIKYHYSVQILCTCVSIVVVFGKPPGRERNPEPLPSGITATLSHSSGRLSILRSPTMDIATEENESTSNIFVTDVTEDFTESDLPNGSSNAVNFTLAAGLGLTALLVVLLSIAFALVMYQKHEEKKEAERQARESGPPPVPKRPDVDDREDSDHLDSNSNSPKRDPSGLSYDYVRPEPVRIAAAHQRNVSPKTRSRRKDGGEEYYSVVQESSPRFSHLNGEQRRKSDTENNYYISVVENDDVGVQKAPKENPYYMQVEEGATDVEHADYVIEAIGKKGDLKSPKRQDSEHEYYSKVYTLNRAANASNTGDGRHDNDDYRGSSYDGDEYSYPPDAKIDNDTNITTQDSHKYSNIQVMKTKNKTSKSKEDVDAKQSKPSNNKKQKSVIYMNIGKLKKVDSQI